MLIAVAKYSELFTRFLCNRKQYASRIQIHKCSSPPRGKGRREAEKSRASNQFLLCFILIVQCSTSSYSQVIYQIVGHSSWLLAWLDDVQLQLNYFWGHHSARNILLTFRQCLSRVSLGIPGQHSQSPKY